MQIRRGRMIDHIQLRVRDLKAARRFYGAVFGVLGIEITDGDTYFYADELWVDEGPADQHSHIHLGFQAKDRATVDAFHAAGLAAGGHDHGGPGEREYHPGYYAAFLLDPDGNNVEAVFHGPHQRSTDAVVVTWEE